MNTLKALGSLIIKKPAYLSIRTLSSELFLPYPQPFTIMQNIPFHKTLCGKLLLAHSAWCNTFCAALKLPGGARVLGEGKLYV